MWIIVCKKKTSLLFLCWSFAVSQSVMLFPGRPLFRCLHVCFLLVYFKPQSDLALFPQYSRIIRLMSACPSSGSLTLSLPNKSSCVSRHHLPGPLPPPQASPEPLLQSHLPAQTNLLLLTPTSSTQSKPYEQLLTIKSNLPSPEGLWLGAEG